MFTPEFIQVKSHNFTVKGLQQNINIASSKREYCAWTHAMKLITGRPLKSSYAVVNHVCR